MALQILLRILSWKDFPGLSGWAINVITSPLIRGRGRFDDRGEGHMTEAERFEDATVLAFKKEEGANKPRNTRNTTLEAGRARN